MLKERARAGNFVFAPDRLRPNALREMLARLTPYAFSLASPHAVRGAICHHFGPSLALHAIEGLVSRHPGMSARTRPALWQRLAVVTAALAGNPSSGYVWRLNKAGSENLASVKVDDLGYGKSSGRSKSGHVIVGAPAPYRFRITGLTPGYARLHFEFVRPWIGKPIKTEDLRVRVE